MGAAWSIQVVTGTARTGSGVVRTLRLVKRVTTLGSSADNDLVLHDARAAASHAYLQLEASGELHVISVSEDIVVNGKKRSRSKLASGDRLRLGTIELLVQADAPPVEVTPVVPPLPQGTDAQKPTAAAIDPLDRATLSAYRKLQRFSEKLLSHYEPDELLSALIDAVVEVTGADQGFLVLQEEGRARVHLARTGGKAPLADPASKLSDSIVDKVLRTGHSVIVSDALRDTEWSHAQSVMDLKLSSVMCVPMQEGGSVLGALYVGCNRISSLFKERDLEVLMVLAAQGALILKNARLVQALRSDNQRLGQELAHVRSATTLSLEASASPAMHAVLRTVAKVAGTDVSVLITGETGTGKELIAQELHRRSPRKKAALVAINCGAIPEQLLESELFGYARGAFTGADRNKPGRFQAANGGTLFLDEIGEMPLGLQVKLLRVLQERAVMRVGDNRLEPIDVRVLCATHRDLSAEIRQGRFREDLYYRLSVVPIHLPPLRERREDIVALAKFFLHRGARDLGTQPRTLSRQAEVALCAHPWPGNIRELENCINKALVLAERTELSPDDLGLGDGRADAQAARPVLSLAEAKEQFSRAYILQALARNGDNRAQTARELDVDPRTVFRFLEQSRTEKPDPSTG